MTKKSSARRNHRNGYRDRLWTTRVGEVPLRIPKLRTVSFFSSLLDPRRRAEQALGLSGIDKSRISRICKGLDELVAEFRQRPIEGQFLYVWLDALFLKVRQNQRIVNQAVVIAMGINEKEDSDSLRCRSRQIH